LGTNLLRNIVAMNYFHRFVVGEEVVGWVWFGWWIFNTEFPEDDGHATVNKHVHSVQEVIFAMCITALLNRVLPIIG